MTGAFKLQDEEEKLCVLGAMDVEKASTIHGCLYFKVHQWAYRGLSAVQPRCAAIEVDWLVVKSGLGMSGA